MIGAIIGDMVGAPYEFETTKQPKNFKIWNGREHFTDDTVMTVAVADALLNISKDADEKTVKDAVVQSMQKWGRKYPYESYGIRFGQWLMLDDPQPYNSWGNGSAMRTSSIGWLYPTLERTLEVAKWVAEVTHNHEEGIKGAQSVSEAIFLARSNMICYKDKEHLKNRLMNDFGYDLNRNCDDIRPTYEFNESCQETVPQAMVAFFDGTDFEDVLRNAVSLGGDCDTLTCIACSIAEAYYHIPFAMREKAICRLTSDILGVIDKFYDRVL